MLCVCRVGLILCMLLVFGGLDFKASDLHTEPKHPVVVAPLSWVAPVRIEEINYDE